MEDLDKNTAPVEDVEAEEEDMKKVLPPEKVKQLLNINRQRVQHVLSNILRAEYQANTVTISGICQSILEMYDRAFELQGEKGLANAMANEDLHAHLVWLYEQVHGEKKSHEKIIEEYIERETMNNEMLAIGRSRKRVGSDISRIEAVND